MKYSTTFLSLLPSLLLLASAGTAQSVITVGPPTVLDPTFAADFLTIQEAVDAAQPGDLILVSGSFQGSFMIDGKGLTIAPLGGQINVGLPAVQVTDERQALCAIENLPPGETVTLIGIDALLPQAFSPTSGLYLADNAGSVFAQSCTFQLFNFFEGVSESSDGITISNSSRSS